MLLEAKGPGYAGFIKNGEFWFQGAKAMVKQAFSQRAAAKGIPIRWVVAKPEAATAIRKLFTRNNLEAIEVVYIPPLP